ncbi:hypothetical protein C8F01DRAFT_159054 [Mycena amicta]|nr:hypothetical protein C8F01DRAFT_159054 [Mycena amicta]
MSVHHAAEGFHDWAKTYGASSRPVSVFNRPFIIILDSLEAAEDLLEKRGSLIYSDRPRLPLYELFGWDGATSLLPYGKRLAKHRQMHNVYLNQRQCDSAEYKELQLTEARDLARNLLNSPPEGYESCLGRCLCDWNHKPDRRRPEDCLRRGRLSAHVAYGTRGPPGGSLIDFLPFCALSNTTSTSSASPSTSSSSASSAISTSTVADAISPSRLDPHKIYGPSAFCSAPSSLEASRFRMRLSRGWF